MNVGQGLSADNPTPRAMVRARPYVTLPAPAHRKPQRPHRAIDGAYSVRHGYAWRIHIGGASRADDRVLA